MTLQQWNTTQLLNGSLVKHPHILALLNQTTFQNFKIGKVKTKQKDAKTSKGKILAYIHTHTNCIKDVKNQQYKYIQKTMIKKIKNKFNKHNRDYTGIDMEV